MSICQTSEPEVAEYTQQQDPAAAFHRDEKIVEPLLSSLHDSPSEKQMQDALRVAMNAGHENVVLQLLNYGIIDLNFEFHESENASSAVPTGMGYTT